MLRSFKRLFDPRGILLVEVLMVTTILSAVIVVIIRSYIASLRASVAVADYSLAASLLDNTMTEYLERGFIERDLGEEGVFPAPYGKFRYALTTARAQVPGGSENLNEITLTALWDAGGKTKKLSFSAFVFHPTTK